MYSEDCKLCVQYCFSFHGIITPSQACFSLSVCGLHVSLFRTASLWTLWRCCRQRRWCLHCGKYEIKRKSLINWQQAPQDRGAGDGMISLTWGWSAGPLRRGWWIYSRVRCLAGKKKKKKKKESVLFCVFFLSFGIRMFILRAHFFKPRCYFKTNKFDVLAWIVFIEFKPTTQKWINHFVLIHV